MRNDIPMPECIRCLARKRSDHPAPHLITMLIQQCKNYGTYPSMGPKILETMDAIEAGFVRIEGADE